MTRVQEHGTAHNRNVLDGAFSRRYDASGKWVGYYDMHDRPCDFDGQLVGGNVEEVTPRYVPVLMKGVI